MNQTSTTRLPLLDALRTVAAAGVLFFHVPALFIGTLFQRGYLFVDLFFLISGFVLALSSEEKMRRDMGAWTFLLGRARRLWPMMALGSLAGAFVFAAHAPAQQIAELLVLSLLFIPLVTGSPTLYPLNAPQWSLLWELAANLMHGLLLRRLTDTLLLWLAGLLGLALIASILTTGCNCVGPNTELWWLTSVRVGWSYTMGVWMARKWSARRPRPITDWKVALALPILVVGSLPLLPIDLATGDAVTAIVILPALFWICAVCAPPRTSSAWLRRVGTLSFPIYAVNMPVVKAFTFWDAGPLSQLAAVVATMVLASLIAWIMPMILSLRLSRRLNGSLA